MNNNTVAKLVKTHGTANNSTDYTPVFVNQSARDTSSSQTTGIGYYTATWFGVHNPQATAKVVTIWTVDQGISGSGVDVRILPGETFYATLSKLTVDSDMVLLGIPTTFSR
jgi:hypothetical protein